jgi:hypothetical protein
LDAAAGKNIIFRDGTTENARINGDGCLSIGATSPTAGYKLYVNGSSMTRSILPISANTYTLGDSSYDWKVVYTRNIISPSTLYLDSGSSASIVFRPGGTTEQARFNTSGQLQLKSSGKANATLIGPETAGTFHFPNTGGTFVTHETRGTAVGSGTKLVYIASTGRATVSTSTQGGTAQPVYLSNGTITPCSSTVGSNTAPTYMEAGTIKSCAMSASGNRWGVLPYVNSGGVLEIGQYIDFHISDADTGDYAARLYADGTSIVSNVNLLSHTGSTDSRSVQVTNSNGTVGIHVSTNKGLYDFSRGKWLIYTRNSDSTTRVATPLYCDDAFTCSSLVKAGSICLTNETYTGYGTADPSTLTAVKGRVYFKIIE